MWQGIARNAGAVMQSLEIIATDGPRRAIARYVVAATYRGGPYEVVIVEGTETDGAGRARRGVVWDDAPDDELRERLRSWDPDDSSSATPHARLERAFNERDWAALDDVLTEDYAWTDHRPGLRAELSSRAEFVEMLKTITAGNDLRWETVAEDMTEDGRAGFGRIVQRGTYRGGPYEIAFLTIFLNDPDGRSPRGEIFAEDDEAAARARLEELRSLPTAADG